MKLMKTLVAAAAAVMMTTVASAAPVGIYVDGESIETVSSGDGWNYNLYGRLVFTGGDHVISGSANDSSFSVVVSQSCNLRLDNVLIRTDDPFIIEKTATDVNLTLVGDNSLEAVGTFGVCCGLKILANGIVTIDAEPGGSLAARGPTAIGGWFQENPILIINGGKITATSSGYHGCNGSAIGAQASGSDVIGSQARIIINGGNITAKGDFYQAGIGCHQNETVTINAGQVEAIGGGQGAGIGSSPDQNCGKVTINGGRVRAVGGVSFVYQAAAGIGGGFFGRGGRVTINGGTVYAAHGLNTLSESWEVDDIGGGGGAANPGTLVITGGSVFLSHDRSATPYNALASGSKRLALAVVENVTPDDSAATVTGIFNLPENGYTYGVNDLYPLSGKLYFWLPDVFEKLNVEVNGTSYELGNLIERRAMAVWTAAEEKLTFYYDSFHRAGGGRVEYAVANAEAIDPDSTDLPAWCANGGCKYVEFDSSFAAYRPKQCLRWFAGLEHLVEVSGTEFLNVSRAVSLNSMFYGCTSLTELNFYGFDTSSVTNMQAMFYDCSSLQRINSSDSFSTVSLADDASMMFRGCVRLEGGNGYRYSEHQTSMSAEFARHDTDVYPGYFTPLPVPVAVYSAGELRFYYDALDHSSEGTVYRIDTADFSYDPPWYSQTSYWLDKVVFDISFINYEVTSCHAWFKDAAKLKTIVGIGCLNLRWATDLSEMFANCTSLEYLNLSSCDMSRVVNMRNMFANCTALRKIAVSSKFSLPSLSDLSQPAFSGCTALVGGAGFAYNPGCIDLNYARMDTEETPGYFSDPAPVAVAVFSSAKGTLTFYYDLLEHAGEGEVYALSDMSVTANQEWYVHRDDVTEVVFDESFADFQTPHCRKWFYNFANLTTLTGLRYLDTSEATSMFQMFASCGKLTELDLTTFDTAKVTTMQNMFYKCSALETIFVSSAFTTANLTNPSELVFDTNTALVGGNGTAFSKTNRSAVYARIDRAGAPGYFTEAGLNAVAVLSSDGLTLRFYYDTRDHSSEGTVYSVAAAEAQDPKYYPPWHVTGVTRMAFDPLFINYRPKHCGNWFAGFSALEAIDGLGYLDVSEATSLREMFYGCTALTEVDLSAFNTANVTDMSGMFQYCSSLTALDVSSFDTQSVTTMKEMFAGLRVTELDLYNFRDPSLETMEGMFAVCRQLRTIYVSVNFSGDWLTTPTPFGSNDALVGGSGTRFSYEDHGIEYARIDRPDSPGLFTMKTTAKAVLAEDGQVLTFYYDDQSHLAEGVVFAVPEPKPGETAVEPMWSSFGRLTVTGAVIDVSFAAYRPKSCAYWFYRLEKLQDIAGLSNLDVSEATDLEFMFGACRSLTELDVSTFDTASAENMHLMFWACDTLKTIYASDRFVTTALADAEDDLFSYSAQLQGGAGMAYDAARVSSRYAHLDSVARPGYFTSKSAPGGGFVTWAAAQGLMGADAAWDAKPALWGGKWANAFIYTYGEGLADGTLTLMDISFGLDGKPVITTTPVVDGHDDFTPSVIGTTQVNDWTSPVELENADDTWTLKEGDSANFFRVRLSE